MRGVVFPHAFMTDFLAIDDFDCFREVKHFARDTINEEVLETVRGLDEREFIEPYIRKVINDFNETPHNSAEIADILTHTISAYHDTGLTAIVIKGKSFKQLTPSDTAYQFLKLNRIRGLKYAILAYVGSRLDEVIEQLGYIKDALGCKYSVFDAVDLARLFIAYGLICPNDGNVLIDAKCECGYEFTRNTQKRERLSTVSIAVVNDVERFERLVVSSPIYIETRVNWKRKRGIVSFKNEPIDTNREGTTFYFIIGKAGAGKSTYLLWNIEIILRDRNNRFEDIIFVNPEADISWAKELSNYDPDTTLLVVDSLGREADEETVKKRYENLFDLVIGSAEVEGQRVGPFNTALTLRDDEYRTVATYDCFSKIKNFGVEIEISRESINFYTFIPNYLEYYAVTNEVPNGEMERVVRLLIEKSEGNPFYIEALINDLDADNRPFSEAAVKRYPEGMIDLVWGIIKNRYSLEGDYTIPFVLQYLLEAKGYHSDAFIALMINTLTEPDKVSVIINKLLTLLRTRTAFDVLQLSDSVRNAQAYKLNHHWRYGMRSVLEWGKDIGEELRSTVDIYKETRSSYYERFRVKIESALREVLDRLLESEIIELRDVLLCSDYAKINSDTLRYASSLYKELSLNATSSTVYLDLLKAELAQKWIYEAWGGPRGIPEYTIECYRYAVEELEIDIGPLRLSDFAYLLQTNELPKLDYGTDDYKALASTIEGYYYEVIETQKNQGVEDPITFHNLALFYKSIRDYKNAELYYEKVLSMNPNHLHTLNAYAIYLAARAKAMFYDERDHETAVSYYQKAEQLIERGLEIFEKRRSNKNGRLDKEDRLTEQRIYRTYADFQVELGGISAIEDKNIYNKKADETYDWLVSKYPGHRQSIYGYANFLMRFGKYLDKYEGGAYLIKAEHLLRDYIARCAYREKPDDPNVLHVLARLIYYYKPLYDNDIVPEYREAVNLLLKSSELGSKKHKSICFHEIAKVYMRWALLFDKDSDAYSGYITEADNYYQSALRILPLNPSTYYHLSRVCLSYAWFDIKYKGGMRCKYLLDRAYGLAVKDGLIRLDFSETVDKLGDELIRETPDEALYYYRYAARIERDHGKKKGYPYYKIAECYRRIADKKTNRKSVIEGLLRNAVENYVLSAEYENTVGSYDEAVGNINRILKDYNVRKDMGALYTYIMTSLVTCERGAFIIDSGKPERAFEYGRALFKNELYKEAKPILEGYIELMGGNSERIENQTVRKARYYLKECDKRIN